MSYVSCNGCTQTFFHLCSEYHTSFLPLQHLVANSKGSIPLLSLMRTLELYLVSSGTMTRDGRRCQRNQEDAASLTAGSSVTWWSIPRHQLWGPQRRCPSAEGKGVIRLSTGMRVQILRSQIWSPSCTHFLTPKNLRDSTEIDLAKALSPVTIMVILGDHFPHSTTSSERWVNLAWNSQVLKPQDALYHHLDESVRDNTEHRTPLFSPIQLTSKALIFCQVIKMTIHLLTSTGN